MDILLEAAKYYKENLENAKFVIQAGKNDNLITFILCFNAKHFKHLLGLHKLTDIPIMNRPSEILYHQILDGKTTYDDIKKSVHFNDIESRINNFKYLKEIILSSKYLRKSNNGLFYRIKADLLFMKNKNNNYINLFSKMVDGVDIAIPVSFFSSTNPYYLVEKSSRWTILAIHEMNKDGLFGSLTEEEFNKIIEKSMKDIEEGRVYTAEEVDALLDELLKR